MAEHFNLMGMVNEIHELRNKNAALTRALEQNAVRLDEMLEGKLPGLVKVSVGMSPQEFVADKSGAIRKLTNRIADAVLEANIYTMNRPGLDGSINVYGYLAAYLRR